MLHIRAERKVGERGTTEEGSRVLCSERRQATRFSRSFTLPDGALPEQVHASMDRGVLTVTVPKTPPAEPKRITVHVAQALPAFTEHKKKAAAEHKKASPASAEHKKRRHH